MAVYRPVYDSRHLQADCQEPESVPEPYARQSSMGYLYLFLHARLFAFDLKLFKQNEWVYSLQNFRRLLLLRASFDNVSAPELEKSRLYFKVGRCITLAVLQVCMWRMSRLGKTRQEVFLHSCWLVKVGLLQYNPHTIFTHIRPTFLRCTILYCFCDF